MSKFLTLVLMLVTMGATATDQVPAAVRANLAIAGKNRGELEKVITYYRKAGDALKLKAVYFLIGNMDIHYSANYYWEGKNGKPIAFNELDYPDLGHAVAAFEKIRLSNPGIHPRPFTAKDLNTLTADYLIHSINDAFQEWRSNPDYKNIPFNDFCEYLLPYRVSIEPQQSWRPAYNKEFAWIAKKYKSNGLATALSFASVNFTSWFSNSFSWYQSSEPLPRLGAMQLLQRRKGPCEDIADLVAFTMRSQGIPAAINYVPYWATSTASHFLNTVFDSRMHPISFDAIGTPAVNTTLAREPSKVLRLTYSKQSQTIASLENPAHLPPGFLRTRNYLDVTKQFWPTTNISCQLFPAAIPVKYAFISVFNGLSWRATWWAIVSQNKAVFPDMPKGAVFLPVYYINGRSMPAGYPIAVGYNHEMVLKPDTVQKQAIFVREESKYLAFQSGRSYKLYYWDNSWKYLAQRKAGPTTHQLLFAKVPRNALFLLIPEYSEQKERPFMILDDGRMKWW